MLRRWRWLLASAGLFGSLALALGCGGITDSGGCVDTGDSPSNPQTQRSGPDCSRAGGWLWARQGGGPGIGVADALAVLEDGSAYLGGAFFGETRFGETSLNSPTHSAFLVKYDDSGEVLWARQGHNEESTHPASDSRVAAVATLANGTVYAAGMFGPEVRFGAFTLTTPGRGALFLTKYDGEGSVLWATQTGRSGIVWPEALALEGDGSAYVAGRFEGSVTFGSTSLRADGADVFLAKYTALGGAQWAVQVGGPGFDGAKSAALSVDGSLYVAGSSVGALAGKTGPSNSRTAALKSKDAEFGGFLAKYDSDGQLHWTTPVSGFVQSVAASPDGSVYVVGHFNREATFGSATFSAAGWSDGFLAKYSPEGRVEWAVTAGGNQADSPEAVTVFLDGSVYVTGTFRGTTHWGAVSMTAWGENDLFLVKVSADGEVLWADRAGAAGWAGGVSVGALADGSAYVAGYLDAVATFGNTTLTAAGMFDVFLAKHR